MDIFHIAGAAAAAVVVLQNRNAIGAVIGLIDPEVAATKTAHAAAKRIETVERRINDKHANVRRAISAHVDTRTELASVREAELAKVNARFDAMSATIDERIDSLGTKMGDLRQKKAKVRDISSAIRSTLA